MHLHAREVVYAIASSSAGAACSLAPAVSRDWRLEAAISTSFHAGDVHQQ